MNPFARRIRTGLLTCAACAAAAACGMGPSVETVALRGTVLTDSVSLASPDGLMVWGGSLLVHDPRAVSAVRIFDTAGRVRGSTGRRGLGPGEFADPAGVLPRPGHPGEFWVYDARLSRVTPFRVADLLAGGTRPAAGAVQLGSSLVVEAPLWLDGSTLVAQSPMLRAGEKRFTFFGADGTVRGSAGEEPEGDEKFTSFLRQQLYGGQMAAHPRRPWFVVVSHFAGRVEVYGRDGARVRRFDVPDAFEPDASPAPDGVNFISGERQRIGYADVAVTDQLVFALFSGRVDKGRSDAVFGDRVHVFDWNGKLLRILDLDTSALQIALSDDGRTLYAVRHDPYPQILSYPLPPIASSAES